MTKPRSRRTNGSMADQIQKHVSPDRTSPSENNDIATDFSSDSPSRPVTKRKRGWAKPLNDWGTGKKLIVELNAFNQPIGETAPKLESQLGVIARNAILCPITFTSWKCKELDSKKERIWNDVKDNCEVADTYKVNFLKSVGDKWRKWKWRIKKDHYSKFDNDEERLANVPPRVNEEQWKLFVQYQATEMAKDRSETNRENQKQKVMAHTSGRKSHQVVREELIKEVKKGDRLDVYVKTHRNSKEKPVDQEAAKALDVIDNKLKEKPESEQTLEFREKIFIDVFGPDTHGRVRSFGKGPSPTQVFGKRNNQSQEQYAQDLERMREMGRDPSGTTTLAEAQYREHVLEATLKGVCARKQALEESYDFSNTHASSQDTINSITARDSNLKLNWPSPKDAQVQILNFLDSNGLLPLRGHLNRVENLQLPAAVFLHEPNIQMEDQTSPSSDMEDDDNTQQPHLVQPIEINPPVPWTEFYN